MPGIAYDPELINSNAVAEGLGGQTHASGVPYPARLSERSTPYTKFTDEMRRVKLILDRLLHVMGLHAEKTDTPLEVGVTAGVYSKEDGTRVSFAEDTMAVDDDATRHLWIDKATNTLTTGAAWPSTETDYIPVATVTAAGGVVTSIEDRRGYLWNRLPPTGVDSGTTGQTAFTTDADNAGAGADGGYKHNRGSSGGGEDAMLKWVEASTLWRVLALDVTGTRAAIDALSLQVGGAEVINSSGKLLAAALDAALLYTFGETMLRITAAAGAGAPAAGTHGVGALHCDSVGVLWICTAAGTPGTWTRVGGQAGLITTTALSDTLADQLVQISIPDVSGASPQTVSIQAKDAQGNNLAEVVYVRVAVYDDADGATLAANATIAVGANGTLIRSLTATKDLVCKTNSSGQLDLAVTDGSAETLFVLAAPTFRSRRMDCADIGTAVIA